MATRMQQRRGTAEQWLLADPVLAAGEIGFETDTGSFKIGDGVNSWLILDYFETSASLSGTLDDYVPLTQKGAPNGVAELDVNGFVPAEQLDIDLSNYYTSTEVDTEISTAISGLLDGAPGVLDTLNEIAAAIGDDADFITTINTSISDAESAAIAAAATDATNKANAAQAAAEATASAALTSAVTDLEAYADQAEADAKTYADDQIAAIPSVDLTGYATETYVNDAIDAVVGLAPETLDTLAELADALGDNPAAITDLQTAVAAKQDSLTAGTNIDITDSTISVTGLASTDISDFNAAAISATAAEYDAAGSATTAEANAKSYTDTAISGVNTTISNLTTDEVDEGTTNKYFSDTLARGAVSAGDGLDYDSQTGTFSAGVGYGLKIDVDGNIQVDGDFIATDLDVANIIGDETVDGTAGNTVTDRIASAVSGLVDSAPSTLDTLNELAAALGDDANFATTVTNSIAAKADAVHTHLLANITDVTATATELNYVSGVTSALQTQLDGKAASSHTHAQSDITDLVTDLAAKAPLASPSFTGTVDFSNATVQGIEIPQPLHPFSMIG